MARRTGRVRIMRSKEFHKVYAHFQHRRLLSFSFRQRLWDGRNTRSLPDVCMKPIRVYPIIARTTAVSTSSLANWQREQMTAWNLPSQVICYFSERKTISVRKEGRSSGRKMLDPVCIVLLKVSYLPNDDGTVRYLEFLSATRGFRIGTVVRLPCQTIHRAPGIRRFRAKHCIISNQSTRTVWSLDVVGCTIRHYFCRARNGSFALRQSTLSAAY